MDTVLVFLSLKNSIFKMITHSVDRNFTLKKMIKIGTINKGLSHF